MDTIQNLTNRLNERKEKREEIKKEIDKKLEEVKPLRVALRKLTNYIAHDEFRLRNLKSQGKSK